MIPNNPPDGITLPRAQAAQELSVLTMETGFHPDVSTKTQKSSEEEKVKG